MKKPSTKEIIKAITLARSRNNDHWMKLLELAVTAKPREAKDILRCIKENDERISKWMSHL